MKEEIKEKWLKALRSGNYKQTKRQLKSKDRFCCLGVLCDIYLKEKSKSWIDNHLCEESSAILPIEIVRWSGLSDKNPRVSNSNDENSLAMLNDKGKSFEEIADLIEEQL